MSQPRVPRSDPRVAAAERLQQAPDDPVGWLVYADMALDAGDVAGGGRAAANALHLRPGDPEALARMGRAYWMGGKLQDAVAHLRAAAAAAPAHAGIQTWLGHVLEDAGEGEAARDAYACAHANAPHEPEIAATLLAWQRRLCDWNGLDALSRQVRTAVRDGSAPVEPFAFLAEDADAMEQLRCARTRATGLARSGHAWRPLARGTRPRIGFLSNGFGAHPTGLLTVALFETLRTEGRFDVHLFATSVDDHSQIRRRLAAATTLHEVASLDHAACAEAIAGTGVDVLFDLRGWGGGGSPQVLALRPAPVQVNWLAYPGTSGAPWIDYVLADGFVLPERLAPAFSERVVRMPRCFQPNDTTRTVAPAKSRAACRLPPDGIVFCCFNNSYKLNPRSFGRAMAILAQVPGSVLWLLSGPADADRRLRAAAAAAGIDSARLLFAAKLPHAEYLSRLQHADLFLDTSPYNAHTTASDALWAGCPVLTTPGETFASRVAGSLNYHLGMDDLNLADDAAFIARAVALARDPAALRALRERLVRLRAGTRVFDMAGFARDFGVMLDGLLAPAAVAGSPDAGHPAALPASATPP